MAVSPLPPSSPSDNGSTASFDTSSAPHSPLIPQMSDLHPDTNQNIVTSNSVAKRKPSRRANTAERRATHNAVERQRRETLNGRFLDLAALLPNLSQIRRPSKSAIVNSSIAHIHAARRHRIIASRELRLIKHEADALRRELNEWRDRSGLPRVEEPVRGDGFSLILSGEIDVVLPANANDDDEGFIEEDEDDINGGAAVGPVDDSADKLAKAAAVALLKSNSASPTNAFGHQISPVATNAPTIVNHAHSSTRAVAGAPQAHAAVNQLLPGGQQQMMPPVHQQMQSGARTGPIIAGHHSGVSFENPIMISPYEGHSTLANLPQHGYGGDQFGNGQLPPHILAQLSTELENKTNNGWYNTNMGSFSPLSSSSGGGSPTGSPFGMSDGFTYQPEGVYGDDVTSMGNDRERSSSLGGLNRSAMRSYDLVGGASVAGIPRWMGEDNNMVEAMRVGGGAGAGVGYPMMM
jgi:hypothetical protein